MALEIGGGGRKRPGPVNLQPIDWSNPYKLAPQGGPVNMRPIDWSNPFQYPFTTSTKQPQYWPSMDAGLANLQDFTRSPQYWGSMDAEIANTVDALMGKIPVSALQPQQQPTPGILPGGGGGGGRGGGGGGGGTGELPGPDFLLRDVMEHLRFPYKWQYPSYLRDFGRYIEELLTTNPQYAIPVPGIEEGTGELLPTPEDLTSLDYMAEAEDYAGAWNMFIQSLTNLPFFQQQYRVGLRYTPDTGWFRSGDMPQLPHPSYL